MRRIVTTQGADGRSMIMRDGAAPWSVVLEKRGGLTLDAVWEVEVPPESPVAGGDPDGRFLFQLPPAVARFLLLTVPPDSRVNRTDPAAVEAMMAEIEQKAPDMLTVLDPARGPGMHATDTIDFNVVVSGRVILAVENGEAELGPGDCVVQRGTWHAWRNPWDEPCIMATTMLRTADTGDEQEGWGTDEAL
jgi:mannose-6-phosphate isomerase-like protein (cupin superfamily)